MFILLIFFDTRTYTYIYLYLLSVSHLYDYHIYYNIGKGGFGKVNAVMSRDTQEILAMKRLEKSSVLKSPLHLDLVWNERKILSKTTSHGGR